MSFMSKDEINVSLFDEVKRLKSQLALAREGLEKIYWALEDQCCEEQPIACSLRDIAEEALAKLAETK